ncbi:hypothetical protein PLESTM_000671100 [Pleodorina starrii]|nr:hypothetical protein PLESTM_000671100 [Pleodorina starrii]
MLPSKLHCSSKFVSTNCNCFNNTSSNRVCSSNNNFTRLLADGFFQRSQPHQQGPVLSTAQLLLTTGMVAPIQGPLLAADAPAAPTRLLGRVDVGVPAAAQQLGLLDGDVPLLEVVVAGVVAARHVYVQAAQMATTKVMLTTLSNLQMGPTSQGIPIQCLYFAI